MRYSPILILVVGLPLSACDDPTRPPEPPSTGTLVVSITTGGEDPDPDGYRLSVDNADTLDLELTGTAELELASGRHTLRLLDVAEQCSVAPGPTLELDVPGGRRTPAAFEVSCPATRARVTVETSGLHPDPDGYLLTIDDFDTRELTPTAVVEVGLSPGRHSLSLLGVSVSCSVAPATAVEVEVPAGSTVPVAFEVTCNTGASVTVRTTGLDIDPNRYRLLVDDSDRGGIGVGLNIGLDPGSHTIGLTDLASNCAFDSPGSLTVTVVASEVVPVEFAVACTATSGVIGVVISGGPAPTLEATMDGVTRFPVGPSGRGYLTGVPAGDHVVSLGGPPNCSVETGAQSVTVTAGTLVRDTVEVTFSVTCVTGVRVAAPTIGPIPQDDYSVWLCYDSYSCRYKFPARLLGHLAPNDTLTAEVNPGTYWFYLDDLVNCRVTGGNPFNGVNPKRNITVGPGQVVSVSFPVSCS
jgi:hypothetical protein